MRSEAFFDEEEELKNYKSRIAAATVESFPYAQRFDRTRNSINSSIAFASVTGERSIQRLLRQTRCCDNSSDRLRWRVLDVVAAQLVLCEVVCPRTLFPQDSRGSLGAK